jgi:aminopeptidase N
MEYAMCTFVKGKRSFGSLVGTSLHELAHAWFQQLLANNESTNSWMDEGFAEYFSNKAVKKFLHNKNEDLFNKNYDNYFYAVKYGIEEPLTTHSDRFSVNRAFSIGSYTKGEIFLTQLNYIIGEENVAATIKEYYNNFKFKHPTPNDFKRTAEKVSGIHLGWYLNEWIETIHTIDYAIADVKTNEVTLVRVGKMPMPIDVSIIYEDETTEKFYIPLSLMRGEKPTTATILPDWHWGKPKYTFKTSKKIKSVEIDSLGFMADINRANNKLELKN